MERLGKALFDRVLPDQLDDVGQIPEPVRCGHSGRELELDKGRERQEREAVTAHCRRGRIGKGDGFLLTVTRIVTVRSTSMSTFWFASRRPLPPGNLSTYPRPR